VLTLLLTLLSTRAVPDDGERAAPTTATTAAEELSFTADVRPILARRCLPCHGFDPSTREADLRLDAFEHATAPRGRRGERAVTPGDPAASLLVERITTEDEWDRMPPEGEPLTAGEVETLVRWVEQGADYEAHWSWTPVEPPVLPDGLRPTEAVDLLVGRALDRAGLQPGPRADRRTLLRRLSFDLIGLPPTPEELAAFEADPSPDALAHQVDRLLDSPAFGERWARHWLDLVRYAETYGHEFDYPIPGGWRYRDQLIRAFNSGVPYDRMILEHVAGDLLDERRIDPASGLDDSLLATGFWWLGQGTHAPTDVRLDELERVDNQIDVLSKAFLGATVSCARCHDHKFDAISQADYYGFAGYLKSSRRQVAYLDPHGEIAQGRRALEALNRELEPRVEAELRPALARLAEIAPVMLAAAIEVLDGSPAVPTEVPELDAWSFERFDGPDYGDWEVEGDAFTDRPTPANDGFIGGLGSGRGESFANTHFRFDGESAEDADRRTGQLTSRPFVVQHDYLHLLIGGGDRPGLTGVRVRTEDGETREITGTDTVVLSPARIDLGDLRGRTARIEIFDRTDGGWGNIRADELVFSDLPELLPQARRSAAAVARERGLDAAQVRRWFEALRRVDRSDRGHPLAPLFARFESAVEESPAPLGQPLPLDGWTATGEAFAAGRGRVGRLRAVGERVEIVETDGFDSGAIARALQGTVRSPTFEIESPWLLARVRGRGRVRVIIDGFFFDEFNDLLFEEALHDVDSARWTTVAHDLSDYIGHRAWYELSDDDPGAAIELDGLWWSDAQASLPPFAPLETEAATEVALTVGRSLAELGGRRGAALANWLIDAELVALDGAAEEREEFAARCAALPAPVRAVAIVEGDPADELLLARGDHRRPQGPAPRGFITALTERPPRLPRDASGRMELARWIASPDNPLTARVAANRVWHHLFGRGIVASTDDFGMLGETPSHPELLDHLAARLAGPLHWSIKDLIRELVTSETYARAAGPLSARALAVDPDNRLLSVRSPKRLDGETLRDAMLAVSGRLDRIQFGPPVAIHLTEFMTGRGRPSGSGPLDGDGRRSIYLEVRRNFLDPLFLAFDTPTPHSTMGCRNRSNVPTQSLALLNAPLVAELATRTAERLRNEVHPEGRLERLWTLSLGRAPEQAEREAAIDFLDRWNAEGADAWTELTHVVFNLKEFSFIE
jgi:hypothetical protein